MPKVGAHMRGHDINTPRTAASHTGGSAWEPTPTEEQNAEFHWTDWRFGQWLRRTSSFTKLRERRDSRVPVFC